MNEGVIQMDKDEIIHELKGLIFFLAFECYKPDEEYQKRIEKMGYAVNDAIKLLEEPEGDKR